MHARAANATKLRSQFPSKAAQPAENMPLTRLVWRLHTILTNPATAHKDARAAKHRMLRVLGEARKSPLPQRIIAPNTVDSEMTDDLAGCEICELRETLAFMGLSPAKGAGPAPSRSLRVKLIRDPATSSHPRLRHTKQAAMKRTHLTNLTPSPRFSRIRSLRDFGAMTTDSVRLTKPRETEPTRCLDRWENEGGRSLNDKFPSHRR